MSAIEWGHPAVWPWLFATPFVWLALWRLLRARALRRRRYGAEFVERTTSALARATRITLIVVLGFVAWMDPRYGEETVPVSRRGLDLVFCLDTSRSMLARDVAPNRLARAQRDIVSVLPELVGGDRVGLVAFAGAAKLVVPLTHDLDSFRELAALADTDTVRTGGSDLAAAIRKGLELVDRQTVSTTVFVLLTDGEDLEGAGRQAAAEAATAGVVVHAIGYGSTRGSKITVDGGGNGEEFLKSKTGDEVVSALDPDGLRALTAATGGDFLRADVVALPLVDLKRKRLDPMLKRAYDAGEDVIHKTRFQWILLPMVLLLLLEMVWFGGRRS